MNKHTLSLEIPDTLNSCILRVIDSSIYNESVPITCPRLSILVPGFTCAIAFEANPGFCNWNITACDLEIQTKNCDTKFNDLPDGIYAINYSVSPNEYVFVEYNHLRITKALSLYQEALCRISIPSIGPSGEVIKKLEKLKFIYTLLQAAKAKVEVCHEAREGMDLYEYALKQLNKVNCKNC